MKGGGDDNVFALQMNEPALLNTCHSVQVSRILKWRVARAYQADVLLKVGLCCFVCLLSVVIPFKSQQSVSTSCTVLLHQSHSAIATCWISFPCTQELLFAFSQSALNASV